MPTIKKYLTFHEPLSSSARIQFALATKPTQRARPSSVWAETEKQGLWQSNLPAGIDVELGSLAFLRFNIVELTKDIALPVLPVYASRPDHCKAAGKYETLSGYLQKTGVFSEQALKTTLSVF